MKRERSLKNVKECAGAEDREARKCLESKDLSPQLLLVAEKRKVMTEVEYAEKGRWGRAETPKAYGVR
jgi:hypothetical protein